MVCPICLSHARHRFAWIYLNSYTNLKDGSPKRLLHFAPETEFAKQFKEMPSIDYLSADLESPHAIERIDITQINHPDTSFDIVYCSHVLEHVAEDRKAMSEIFRILKPGGWALIQVPISNQSTFEDLSITDPRERARLFGQQDHVRVYGMDIKERLTATGFNVEVVFAQKLIDTKTMSPEKFETLGLYPKEPIFHCTKPAV
jgi:SAM-dependent methyltransferase